MTYEKGFGRVWTYATNSGGDPIVDINPQGERATYSYVNFRPPKHWYGWEKRPEWMALNSFPGPKTPHCGVL